MAQHALLSASGADRWLHCTPSARLEEHIPETKSDYADEGTAAHELAELKLRKKFIEPMSTRSYNAKLKAIKENPLYQEEMQSYTDDYIDYVTEITMSYASKPHVAAEVKVDFGLYVPEGFGTVDCCIIGADTLNVIDLKYGKGKPVFAEKNPQGMLYALGAISKYLPLYDLKKVIIHIFQPRIDNISKYEISRDDLINWGVLEVKPKAQLAFDGEGDYIPGAWCQFCRAKYTCRSRSDSNTALEAFAGVLAPSLKETGNPPVPPLLSDDEVGEVLKRAMQLESWVSDLKEYALNALLEGKTVAGWKVVEGRKTRSLNTDIAFPLLTSAGYDEALLYTRKPLGLTELEKLTGGKKKLEELVSEAITVPPGKPTLVPETDKREPISLTVKAEDVFTRGGIINE